MAQGPGLYAYKRVPQDKWAGFAYVISFVSVFFWGIAPLVKR